MPHAHRRHAGAVSRSARRLRCSPRPSAAISLRHHLLGPRRDRHGACGRPCAAPTVVLETARRSMTSPPKVFDVVALLVDHHEHGLVRGQVGTVIEHLGDNVFVRERREDRGPRGRVQRRRGPSVRSRRSSHGKQGGNYRHRTARRRNAQLAGHSDRNFERGHRHILAAPVERPRGSGKSTREAPW